MWKAVIAGAVVAILLLLGLVILLVLYLRKARGKAQNGELILFVLPTRKLT